MNTEKTSNLFSSILLLGLLIICSASYSLGQCTVFVETPMGSDPSDPSVDVAINVTCTGGHLGGEISYNGQFDQASQTFDPGPSGVLTFALPGGLQPGPYDIRVVVHTASGDLTFGNQAGDLSFEDGSQDFLTIGDPDIFFIRNLQISPGVVDVTSAGKTVNFSFEIENQGLTEPTNVNVSLRSPDPLMPAIELSSGNGDITFALNPNTFMYEASFSQFFPISAEPGNWAIDISIDGSAGGLTQFPDAGGFIVQTGTPGDSQANPVLPDSIDADGNFIFTSIPGGTSLWMDPPTAFGYVYQTTNAPLIASIDALPQGIDADGQFTLYTPHQVYQNITVNDTFDFSSQPGGGIRWFAITGVGPVDPQDAAAFPIQMTFTGTADLCVTVLKMHDINVTGTQVFDFDDFRRPCGLLTTLTWESQVELVYQLESSTDLVSWSPANTPFPVDYWIQGGGMTTVQSYSIPSMTPNVYYRAKARFIGPNIKYNDGSGGSGVVVVSPPPPNPFWPTGPPLPDSRPDNFNGFNITFVPIGDIGNDVDSTGFGSVNYEFRMAQFEVPRFAITLYNAAVDSSLAITMADMTSMGGNGGDQPATGITWYEAARFVNWLNTSQGFPAAYKFAANSDINAPIQLWEPGDNGYDALNPYRNSQCIYFLPSEDEWYKTAYHNAGGTTYFDYPTGSNSAPSSVSGGTISGTAVWNNQTAPAIISQAGGLSPHQTMGQGGNVWEWVESAFDQANDNATEARTTRGGYWGSTSGLHRGSRFTYSPSQEDATTGFRVASRAITFGTCP